MQTTAITNARGEPLQDKNGTDLRVGQRVIDDMFGEGEVRGTEPVEKGDGLNIVVRWIENASNDKPRSRSTEHLVVKPLATTRTFHTGAQFEAGTAGGARVHDDQTFNNGAMPATPGSPDRADAFGAARTAAAGSPRSTRASPAGSDQPSPRDHRAKKRAGERQAEDDLSAELLKPWRGQAEKLKPTQKMVLAQFEERGQRKSVPEDGVFVVKGETKYWCKWDGEGSAKTTQKLNITRMFEELLKSKNCP
eukprot:1391755-Prymnesium_polylepis.1